MNSEDANRVKEVNAGVILAMVLKRPGGPPPSVKVPVFTSKYIHQCLVMGVEGTEEKRANTHAFVQC